MVIVHWTLIMVAIVSVIFILLISGLLWILAEQTRHDLHTSKDGNIYVIVDL